MKLGFFFLTLISLNLLFHVAWSLRSKKWETIPPKSLMLANPSPITWSASLYCIRQGSKVHDTLLEEFLEGHRGTVDDEHCVSSTDRWSVREDYTGFKPVLGQACY